MGRRSGMTLPELVIGLMILGIVSGALVRLLMVQGRFAESQEAYRNSRGVSRDAYNVMMTDLRMVQDTLAIQAASRDSVKVRVPYVYGIVCGNLAGITTASMVPVDSALYAMAKYGGVAWDSAGVFQFKPTTGIAPTYSDPTICLDSSATGAKVDSIVFTDSASGRTRGGRTMSLNPILPNAKPGDPVFIWQEITYVFAPSVAYPGMRGLYRSVTNGATPIRDEIIAPFDTSARFKFYVLNNDTSQAAAPANLNQIKGLDLVLNARSPRIPADSKTPKLTKVRTAVYFKDRRDP
jgi:prepilin-type N-terminal cleavage/methylation domain-containing protein